MGTHEYEDDPRNANVWISINGELFRRPEAKVSVLDAGFLLGDGVWEAFRLHHGVLAFLDDHLDRLWHAAEVIALEIPLSRSELVERIKPHLPLIKNSPFGKRILRLLLEHKK